jgi:hypothetical protein
VAIPWPASNQVASVVPGKTASGGVLPRTLRQAARAARAIGCPAGTAAGGSQSLGAASYSTARSAPVWPATRLVSPVNAAVTASRSMPGSSRTSVSTATRPGSTP